MVEPTKANAPASMAIFSVLAFHWHLTKYSIIQAPLPKVNAVELDQMPTVGLLLTVCIYFIVIIFVGFDITAADGLAGYQMLLMMAKLSTGWTLSSSFSTLDPKQMKQISVGVIAISVFEVQFCVFTIRSWMDKWRKIEHLHVIQSDLIRNALCKIFIYCGVPDNFHTSTKNGHLVCSLPLPPCNFQFRFILSLKKFGYLVTPPPWNFQWPSLMRLWIFSGPTHSEIEKDC